MAGDEESYTVFKEVFDPVIESRHKFPANAKHKTALNPDLLIGGILDDKYIRSSRIRTGRSIRGFGLPPHCTRAERRDIEEIISSALAGLTDEFKGIFSFFSRLTPVCNLGTYYPLMGMKPEMEQQLIDDHFLFDKPGAPLHISCRVSRDWPDGRHVT